MVKDKVHSTDQPTITLWDHMIYLRIFKNYKTWWRSSQISKSIPIEFEVNRTAGEENMCDRRNKEASYFVWPVECRAAAHIRNHVFSIFFAFFALISISNRGLLSFFENYLRILLTSSPSHLDQKPSFRSRQAPIVFPTFPPEHWWGPDRLLGLFVFST